MSDIRSALRQLFKNPGFTAVAVLSLALGIGATTAVFSLVNSFLLQSLPVRDPDALVLLRTTDGKRGRMSRGGENNGGADPVTGRFISSSFSLLTFERLREQQGVLSDLFAFAPFSQVNVLVDGEPETSVSAQLVSGTYYAGLGVFAVVGRTLTTSDDTPASPPAAMISYRYWTRRFANRADVVGQTIHVNRIATTIVGVTPQGFDGALQAGESPDVSVPLAHYLRFQPDRSGRAQPGYWWLRIMGRLAPGATRDQVRGALEPVFQEAARDGWLAGRSPNGVAEEMPDAPTLTADPGGQGENDVRRQFARPLAILMGLAGLVLAAACANVATLLLARSAARRREVAMRMALGSTRGRILRQLLTESLVLAVVASAIGLALSWWGADLLLALRPFGNAAAVLDLPLDRRVLGFTTAVTVATALLFGLAPALTATRVDLSTQFQGGSRMLGSGRRSPLTQAMVVIQIALSLLLLVSTGLFVRTLNNLENVDVGFNRHNLVLFRIDLTSAGYPADQYAAVQARIQERLEALPGVRSTTFSSVALLSGVRQNKRVSLPGQPTPVGGAPIVNTNGLAPNFFAAMELPIVLGRGFTARDAPSAPRVAVVNQEFVRGFLADGDPIGRVIVVGAAPADRVEIVGVSADAKYTQVRAATPATIYFPALQRVDGNANFAVRVGGADRAAMTSAFAAVRSAVREIDPALPVLNLRTQDEQIDRLHAQELLFARLSALFGVLAVVLAAVGLYGLMSHAVARRTGEIGLRMALGALPVQVLTMIVRESLRLVCLGIAVGAVTAYYAVQLVKTMMFGMSPADPVTFGVVCGALFVVAILAAIVPARRASRIDPTVALTSV